MFVMYDRTQANEDVYTMGNSEFLAFLEHPQIVLVRHVAARVAPSSRVPLTRLPFC